MDADDQAGLDAIALVEAFERKDREGVEALIKTMSTDEFMALAGALATIVVCCPGHGDVMADIRKGILGSQATPEQE